MRNSIIFGLAILFTVIIVGSILAQGTIDLNSAGSSELEKLYRVSPKIASKIIVEREKNGPFSSLEDVAVRIKEIGPKTIAKWEVMAVVSQPVAE